MELGRCEEGSKFLLNVNIEMDRWWPRKAECAASKVDGWTGLCACDGLRIRKWRYLVLPGFVL